jgi:hypothetical protein
MQLYAFPAKHASTKQTGSPLSVSYYNLKEKNNCLYRENPVEITIEGNSYL